MQDLTLPFCARLDPAILRRLPLSSSSWLPGGIFSAFSCVAACNINNLRLATRSTIIMESDPIDSEQMMRGLLAEVVG